MKKLLALLAVCSVVIALGALSGTARASGPQPANDAFNNAREVEKLPFSDSISTVHATTEQNEPNIDLPTDCTPIGSGHSHSVWYEYTPGFDQSVDVDTLGSSFDTILAAYTGTKGALTRVACNDDIDVGAGNERSAIKVSLTAGTTYYFLAGSFSNGPGGSLQLNVTPQDDLFFDDITLKCYQAKFAKRSARFQRQTISTADLNFHFEATTSVNALSLYCNQAAMSVHKAGDTVLPGDLKVTCYTARDDQVFAKDGTIAGRRVFASNAFGDNQLVLGRLESVCVPALKASGQIPNLTPYNLEVLRCYTARMAKGMPRFEVEDIGLFDQFEDDKDARVLRPVSFCTLSGKSTNGCHSGAVVQQPCASGNGNSVSHPEDFAIVCYAVRQASFPAIIIPVIDQFIDQQFVDPELRITKADRLCVSSDKKYPFADNDDIDHARQVQLGGVCEAGDEDECSYEDHMVTMKATSARNDPRIVHCESVADNGVRYGHSVWYTFTPDEATSFADIDTEDSSYDTVLVIYTGEKGNLTQVDCNDDGEEGGDVGTSELELELEPYQKYWIMVGAKDRSPGGKLKFELEACDESCD